MHVIPLGFEIKGFCFDVVFAVLWKQRFCFWVEKTKNNENLYFA